MAWSLHQVRTYNAFNIKELDRQINEYLVNIKDQIVPDTICIRLCVTPTDQRQGVVLYTAMLDYDLVLPTEPV
jgi:hypothetical protein